MPMDSAVALQSRARHGCTATENAVLLQRRGEPDDRRAAGASKTDAENRRVAVGGDRRPHLRVVGPRFLRPDRADVHRTAAVRRTIAAAAP